MILSTETVSYKEILRIAFPMVISQAAETVMLFVDRLFLSTVHITAMSAALAGGISLFVFQSFFIGLIGYTTALVAQYYGANTIRLGLQTVSQGIILSLIAYPVSLLIIPIAKLSFIWAGHSPLQVDYEYAYFSILMYGALFTFVRITLTGYFIGIGKTPIVLIANVVGMIVNIPLNYILIFGKLGVPALGLEGAAIGTFASLVIVTIILLYSYLRDDKYIAHKRKQIWYFDRMLFQKLLRYGTPAGIELFLAIAAFNIGIQILHSYGPGVAAAVTITFNYDAVAFIPMLGMGFAATSIVGYYMGAKKPALARTAGFKVWKLGLIYGLGIMILFIFGAKPLVGLFSSQFGEADGEYLELAQKMLQLAAIYTFADMTQLVFASALRGAGDTPWVMKASILIHWVYALVAIYFARVLRLPPLSMWVLFIVFITCLGTCMLLRYTRGKWRNFALINS